MITLNNEFLVISTSFFFVLCPHSQVLKAEGLEKYADVKSVTSELASAMDLTPEELEHVASELIEIASQRGGKLGDSWVS